METKNKMSPDVFPSSQLLGIPSYASDPLGKNKDSVSMLSIVISIFLSPILLVIYVLGVWPNSFKVPSPQSLNIYMIYLVLFILIVICMFVCLLHIFGRVLSHMLVWPYPETLNINS